jgi:aspartate/tyrosine/aromatic aminotransferase
MDIQLGRSNIEKAEELKKLGRDANQIASVLCDQDPEGHNFGIGIVIGSDGRPMSTSQTLLEYVSAELAVSGAGTYVSSTKILETFKRRVLAFQRVPEKLWGQFLVAVPSDAGTGAVRLAMELAFMRDDMLRSLGVEELGWPAYRAIAKSMGKGFGEHAADAVIEREDVLPVYQAGPMNTTGRVKGRDVIRSRAEAAAKTGATVVLDRAYPGFEFAGALAESSYDDVMSRSYDLQLRPYVEAGVPSFVACSPTKAFVSFALRPCGVLLVFCPDPGEMDTLRLQLNTLMRARGSSFEHPATRAFIKASVERPADLEREHAGVLARLAECEASWRMLSKGTAIEALYSASYAGLFRNPRLKEGGAEQLYGRHIYSVITAGRCRHNVTGLSGDATLAAEHVAAFAEYCFE